MNAYVAQALREADRRRAAEPFAPPRTLEAPLSIDQLAVAAAAGDVESVGRLYDSLVGPIYRYVALRVHRREDAEDLTQLVFERIVSSLPRYRSRGRPFEAWAFRIARNAVIDHVRRDRAHEPLGDGHDAGHDETPDTLTVRGEEIREMRNAIATMTPTTGGRPALAAGIREEAAAVWGAARDRARAAFRASPACDANCSRGESAQPLPIYRREVSSCRWPDRRRQVERHLERIQQIQFPAAARPMRIATSPIARNARAAPPQSRGARGAPWAWRDGCRCDRHGRQRVGAQPREPAGRRL